MFTIYFIDSRITIVHKINLRYQEFGKHSFYMDQFKTYIPVISLERVPEGVLTYARTTLFALILSLSAMTRVTSHTSTRCCIFFLTFCLNFSKYNSPFLPLLLLSRFTDVTTTHFTGKQELWNLILVSVPKT